MGIKPQAEDMGHPTVVRSILGDNDADHYQPGIVLKFIFILASVSNSQSSIHPSVHSTQVVSSLVVPWSLFNKLSYALLQKKTLQQKVISTTCKAWITHTKCFSQFPGGKRRYHGSLYDRQFVSRWETAAVSWGLCIRLYVCLTDCVCLSVCFTIYLFW